MVVTSAGIVGHRDHFEDEINLTTVFCVVLWTNYTCGESSRLPLSP